MRDAVKEFGGDPGKINPRLPVDFVVDHSVNVDFHGRADALRQNMALEYQRTRSAIASSRGAADIRKYQCFSPGHGESFIS